MNRKIPFHIPSIGEEEIAELVDTLRNGWLTTGPKTKQFEKDFAAFVGAKHAVAVNSATSGLHLALEALGVRAGDEVIIPTYTFTATGEVVTYLGARPVLADVRRDTFNLDATTIEPLITPRTKAIIPVHVAGQMCDMDPILDLARRHDLRVLDDAAHSLPATYKGRSVGTMGDASVFSFYATKTITTGEGGMVTTDREDLASRMRQMSLHGLSGNAWNRYGDKGSWYYEVLEFGFKYNMTDIAAALGIHQLRRCDGFWKKRRDVAAAYNAAFGALDTCVTPPLAEHTTHSWHLYILQLKLEALSKGRDEILRILGERGIRTSVHFIPLHFHPAYQRAFGYTVGMFPVSEEIFAGTVSLPIYPDMKEEDVAYVIDTVRETLAESRR
jgi:dTDP-4-amino-4,6-dideoxygalactose transaminase